jgi:hypothetical protein
MVPLTAAALITAGAVGTFLQFEVFDLEEQELLSKAGEWGYIAGFVLLALMALPGLVGILLGVRARHLGERRLGATGIVVNVLIAALVVIPAAVNLLFG